MLTNKAVAALTSLSQLSDETLKKKLGADLFGALQEPEVKKCVTAMKMKADVPPGGATAADSQALPPGILLLIQTLGPILLKMLLKRLGITIPT